MTVGPDSLQRHRAAVRARLLRSDHVRAGPKASPGRSTARRSWSPAGAVPSCSNWRIPLIAAGVHDHSSFRGSLLARVSAAALDRRRDAVAHVRRYRADDHRRCPHHTRFTTACAAASVWTRRHEAYSAHDPDLQRWVHATLLESSLLTYERLVGSADPPRAGSVLLGGGNHGTAAGNAGWMASAGRRRSSTPTCATCWRADASSSPTPAGRSRGRCCTRRTGTPPGRRFARMQLLAIGSLPPSIRQAYGFEWRARDARALARWTALLRTSLRLLPPFAREWPIARRGNVASPPDLEGRASPESQPTLRPMNRAAQASNDS